MNGAGAPPGADRSEPCAQLDRVAKSYGPTRVFSGVSMAVRAGRHLALLGPSGCGKSTILRVLAGLEPPSAGLVKVDGAVVSRPSAILVPPHARGMAMVFQDLALWPGLSARQNVELGLTGQRLPRPERRRRSRAALRACEVERLEDRDPASLSGGERQRVALARALAVRPRMLLLDEPFSGLDLDIKSQLCAHIRKLCAELDLTVVLVSHDPAEAIALCAEAVVLEDGGVVEAGPLPQVLDDPASRTLRAFIEHLPARRPERSSTRRRS